MYHEFGKRPPMHRWATNLIDAPVVGEARAPLWQGVSATEFPLTAGKVENLRRAAQAFHGLEMPGQRVFSFWRQLGRTTRRRGYVAGRELREGCMVPATGGGLCQISGLLYQAAMAAGLEVVERHPHSRIVAGSAAERDLDATVFWNYVDLRFRGINPWRLEVELTSTDLHVRVRSVAVGSKIPTEPELRKDAPQRALPSGDCLTCGMLSCFRHPAATAAHGPSLGHSAFLLDGRWPEFDTWCAGHSRDGDRWWLPLDGQRWKKRNYAWTPPPLATVGHATLRTLGRAFHQRRLPPQGAVRQAFLLAADEGLARHYAKKLTPECRHLVISLNLLPHLWQLGVLGGRTFDVLMDRWPLAEMQRRLDHAAQLHPESPTLGDFRANQDLMHAESNALEAAGRLVTPHRAIARHFGSRAWLLDWQIPEPLVRRPDTLSGRPRWFFPASPLGRKGIYELAEALRRGMDADLLVLGRADEGPANPLAGLTTTAASVGDLATCRALVIPAWIEHQPRIALLALASGIPVIASADCGLPEHPLLKVIAEPDAAALTEAMRGLPPLASFTA